MAETMWKFDLGAISIRAIIQPSSEPYDGDDDGETQALIDAGELEIFDTAIVVSINGREIGFDNLGSSVYANPREFFSDHRAADPMNRNCSIMRAARGGNVSICHYFPRMVSEAVADARAWLAVLASEKVAA